MTIKIDDPALLKAHAIFQAEICKLYMRVSDDIHHMRLEVIAKHAEEQAQATRSILHYQIIIRCYVSNDRSLTFEALARLPAASVPSTRGYRTRSERLTGRDLNLHKIRARAREWEFPIVRTLVEQLRKYDIPKYQRLIELRTLVERQLQLDGIPYDSFLHLKSPSANEIGESEGKPDSSGEPFDDYDLGYGPANRPWKST